VRQSEKAGPAHAYINVDDPAFGEVNADMPAAVVAYCERTGQRLENSVGTVSRCVYESLVLKYREKLETLEKITGKNLDVLHLVGGGIQNHTLCQWVADSMGLPVIAGPTETTSVGNLLMQLKCMKEISSLEQGRDISLRSSEVIRYEPGARSQWDAAFDAYKATKVR
jgi:sugar (pentulose or hexulose) kinase